MCVCVCVSLLMFHCCLYVYVCRTGLVFISIGNNKVSDSVVDMRSLSVTAVYDSINFITDTTTVRIDIHIQTYIYITTYKHILGYIHYMKSEWDFDLHYVF